MEGGFNEESFATTDLSGKHRHWWTGMTQVQINHIWEEKEKYIPLICMIGTYKESFPVREYDVQ